MSSGLTAGDLLQTTINFLAVGGQRGVQRPVLPPGTTAPIHPVGFVVITSDQVFGKVLSDATLSAVDQVDADALRVVHITPQGETDVVGVVTTLEGSAAGRGSLDAYRRLRGRKG